MRRTFSSLRSRLAIAFGLFVFVGSSALIVSLHLAERAEALDRFAVTAQANANFVDNARLPLSARTASALSLVHAFDVAFVEPGQAAPALVLIPDSKVSADLLRRAREASGHPVRWGGFETILLPLRAGTAMWFVRQADLGMVALLQGRTAMVLSGFWVLAFSLAVAIGRGIIRPLRSLAEQLPSIDREPLAPLPGVDRDDEIGQLARAFLSARTQLAEERERREKAERLALLGRMATGLAHEIHNPVAAIRMHAQLIASATPAEQAALVCESLPILLAETARIEMLVNQWMFLARPEPPRTSRVELAALLAQFTALHGPGAQHAGVEFEVDVAPGLAVKADARRLGQAVSNVLINAIQAMPEGGCLRIAARAVDGVVDLDFHDQGRGFSPEAIQRHTELFFSEKEGGMGIGLSVASEVLKALGGSLRVGNAPGGGGLVTFQLPLIQ